MKLLFTLIFLILSFHFYSQYEIVVSEQIQSFIVGQKPCIVVNIPYGEPKVIEKQLKKELKSYSGSFYINKGEYTLVQGRIKELGAGTINAYAKIKTEDNAVYKVVITFDLGGVYLSSAEHAAQFKQMCERYKDFAYETSLKCLNDSISIEKEILSSTKKNLKFLEKEKEKLIQEINEYKSFIVAAEKNLELNIKYQGKTFETIQSLENKIEEIEKNKKKVKKN